MDDYERTSQASCSEETRSDSRGRVGGGRREEGTLKQGSKNMDLWHSVIQLGKGFKSGTAGLETTGFLMTNNSARVQWQGNQISNEQMEKFKKYLPENNITLSCCHDFYLQRFLNARLCDIQLAARLAKMYDVWRQSDDSGRFPYDIDGVQNLLESGTMTVFKAGNDMEQLKGHQLFTVLVRPGKWNPRQLPASDALKAASLAVEPLSFGGKRNATLVIIDMSGVGVDHVSSLNPRLLNKIVFFIIECVPVYIDAVHIIYEPLLFRLLFTVFKQFMPEEAKKKVYFHGRCKGKLSQKVPDQQLPPCLKGTAQQIDWLSHINSEPIKRGYQLLGYDIGVG